MLTNHKEWELAFVRVAEREPNKVGLFRMLWNPEGDRDRSKRTNFCILGRALHDNGYADDSVVQLHGAAPAIK